MQCSHCYKLNLQTLQGATYQCYKVQHVKVIRATYKVIKSTCTCSKYKVCVRIALQIIIKSITLILSTV